MIFVIVIFYHWLFVLIISASFQRKAGYSDVLREHECENWQTSADGKIFELSTEQDFLFCILCHLEDDAARNKPVSE